MPGLTKRCENGAIPLTRATTLAGYVRFFRNLGAPVEAGLRRARLPLLFDERPDAWVSHLQLRLFLADMADREGIPDLGLRNVSATRQLHPGFIFPVLRAPTLKAALERLVSTVRYQNTALRIWLEYEENRVRLCMAIPMSRDFPGHEISETRSLKLGHRVVQAFAGPSFEPMRIVLTSRRRDLRFDLDSAYRGVEVLTEQRCSAIEFSGSLLGLEGPGFSAPKTRRIQAGDDVPDPASLKETLAASLVPYLLDGYPSIGLAAEISGCSQRTLQRRLATERSTYSEVVDNARCRSALSQLRAGAGSLARLAGQLGYSEHSAFTRAFRRWTGMTPGEYRSKMVAPSHTG